MTEDQKKAIDILNRLNGIELSREEYFLLLEYVVNKNTGYYYTPYYPYYVDDKKSITDPLFKKYSYKVTNHFENTENNE